MKIQITNGFTIFLCQKEGWQALALPGLLIFE